MAAEGDLKVGEEFRRSKRNLLWFCTFLLLIYSVHTATPDTIAVPMVGTGTLNRDWLLFLGLIGCVYSTADFIRHVMDVQRLHNDAIYKAEFDNLRDRLNALAQEFEGIDQGARGLLAIAQNQKFPTGTDLENSRNLILAKFQEATAAITGLIHTLNLADGMPPKIAS